MKKMIIMGTVLLSLTSIGLLAGNANAVTASAEDQYLLCRYEYKYLTRLDDPDKVTDMVGHEVYNECRVEQEFLVNNTGWWLWAKSEVNRDGTLLWNKYCFNNPQYEFMYDYVKLTDSVTFTGATITDISIGGNISSGSGGASIGGNIASSESVLSFTFNMSNTDRISVTYQDVDISMNGNVSAITDNILVEYQIGSNFYVTGYSFVPSKVQN